MNQLPLQFVPAQERIFDALCFGRVGMDLYARDEQVGLAQTSGFRTSLGGSPGNIAVGMARLGCRIGCISKVATDPIGDYVVATLADEGVDVSLLLRDTTGCLTSLALAAVQRSDCEVVIYRHQAADMQLTETEISAMPIERSRVLVMSGTALSQAPSRQAALLAMRMASEGSVRVVLDLDYRANTWSSDAEASRVYQQAIALADIVLGNLEEWAWITGDTPFVQAAEEILQGTPSVLVAKEGECGGSIYCAGQDRVVYPVFTVQARKPYGAGDAFAATFVQQLLAGSDLLQSATYGSAAAALVVQADACALAMPNLDSIQQFCAKAQH